MKQLILALSIIMILGLVSCRRFRLDNIRIYEDPNSVTIKIEKDPPK